MSFTQNCSKVFQQSIEDYNALKDINKPMKNRYTEAELNGLLYLKNWIDNVQWQLEDLIRDPNIDPVLALRIKRRIDKSNQERTDTVEIIDDWFLNQYKNVKTIEQASINTESPAWALDRLSILMLKIHHMRLQTLRDDADQAHVKLCQQKLTVLLEQKKDLTSAIDVLISDLAQGNKYMKVYKQMKMYNDPNLNPVLYSVKS